MYEQTITQAGYLPSTMDCVNMYVNSQIMPCGAVNESFKINDHVTKLDLYV